MTFHNHLLLFSHEQSDLLASIRDLHVRSKTQPKLCLFLKKCCAVIHEESYTIDSVERERIGACDDLLELAERHVRQNRLNAITENVLFSISQIGQLLTYVEILYSFEQLNQKLKG